MMYWLALNFWTMGQQFVVIRSMPTPGSEAYHALGGPSGKEEHPKGIVTEPDVIEELSPRSASSPWGKNRAKRGKGKK